MNVASIGQHPLDLHDLMLEHGYSGTRAYAQSELAMIMFGVELADRLPGDAFTVNSLHPATYMPTKMVLDSIGHSIDTLVSGPGDDRSPNARQQSVFMSASGQLHGRPRAVSDRCH